MVAVNLTTLKLPEWRYFLGHSLTMEEIGELKRCRGRSMEWDLAGGPFQASMSIPVNLKIAPEVAPGKTCLICKRNGETEWSGPIVTTEDTLPGTMFSIQAVGWYELLNHRIIREEQITGTVPGATWPVPLHYSAVDRGVMAFDLLELANAQLPTLITPGQRLDMDPATYLDKMYERDMVVGQEINMLGEIEGGYDYEVNPTTRELNIWPYRGTTKENVLYAYGVFPRNLASVTRRENAAEIANRITARGKYGNGLAEDTVSQAIYGLYEEVASLSDVTDTDTLLGYAGEEVTLRATPRVIYTIVPKPTGKVGIKPFDHFNLGDTLSFSAEGGRIKVADQGMRVMGFSVAHEDDGKERISSLKTEEDG